MPHAASPSRILHEELPSAGSKQLMMHFSAFARTLVRKHKNWSCFNIGSELLMPTHARGKSKVALFQL